MSGLAQARALAVLVPAALLAAAYGSEILWGLYPCEMCWWQRYAHFAALAFALLSIALRGQPDRGRSFVWLAALAILVSGLIGGYHAGVEAQIFEGFNTCSSTAKGSSPEQILAAILKAPITRCDQIQWSMLGISMAGWNAIVSIGFVILIGWLSLRRPKPLP